MAVTPIVQRAFSAGELAPALAMRADLPLYTAGLRTCRNFVVQRSGGVANRPGFQFIGAVKDSTRVTLLARWVFTAANQSTLIEVGHLYFRFWQNGAPLEVGTVTAWSGATAYVLGDLASRLGVNYTCVLAHTNQQPPNATYWYAMAGDVYEIPTPYTEGSFDSPGPLRFTQNQASLTITHPGYAPRELRNAAPLIGSAPRWVLELVAFGPSIAAPTGLTLAPAVPGPLAAPLARTYSYKVSAIAAETYEESLPSDAVVATDIGAAGETAHTGVHWAAVAGAVEYRVYCDDRQNGTFGYVGTATGQTDFYDSGLAPDLSLTPPINRLPFATFLNWPVMSAYYQQRRLFGYTDNKPATVWASRSGFGTNFCIRSPIQDDDAVTFTLTSRELNVIRHLVALPRLIVLTDVGAWAVGGDEAGVLTPTAMNLDQHDYVGAAIIPPVLVGTAIVYVQARGSIVRDLQFTAPRSLAGRDLSSRDLTELASHLVDGYTIVKLDYQQVPHSIVWAVRSDGTLLGCTYLRDRDEWGWSRHDTGADGVFEDVCVVPEADQDAVYVVVQRTIDGASVRYIERLAPRLVTALEDAVFLDASITYDGASTTAISGLDHLEGEVVMALANGIVRGPFTVSSGAITLPVAASTVQVGLAITADLETLDLDVQGSDLRVRRRRVQSLTAIVDSSGPGFYAGPDVAHLFRQRRESWQSATGLLSGCFEAALTAAFTDSGRVVLRHTDPTPLTVLGIVPHAEVGG